MLLNRSYFGKAVKLPVPVMSWDNIGWVRYVRLLTSEYTLSHKEKYPLDHIIDHQEPRGK